ncbi:hypothetical protein ACH6CV_02070 [Bacillota bacterium Meth-B3]
MSSEQKERNEKVLNDGDLDAVSGGNDDGFRKYKRKDCPVCKREEWASLVMTARYDGYYRCDYCGWKYPMEHHEY